MAERELPGPSTPTTTVFCCGVFVMSPLLGECWRCAGFVAVRRAQRPTALPDPLGLVNAFANHRTARDAQGQTRRHASAERFGRALQDSNNGRDQFLSAACPP